MLTIFVFGLTCAIFGAIHFTRAQDLDPNITIQKWLGQIFWQVAEIFFSWLIISWDTIIEHLETTSLDNSLTLCRSLQLRAHSYAATAVHTLNEAYQNPSVAITAVEAAIIGLRILLHNITEFTRYGVWLLAGVIKTTITTIGVIDHTVANTLGDAMANAVVVGAYTCLFGLTFLVLLSVGKAIKWIITLLKLAIALPLRLSRLAFGQ